ncbi:hypothetical protein CRE_07081 [Caenorhabditis remanei]|uniref:Uncharacterized protein n=1 Tax=Caenorhabditis remanei TaxID=31234 RepID=E3NK53_CAERE|nr:hypothetical protein CRE_07081 [Caenorhabditis remanei]
MLTILTGEFSKSSVTMVIDEYSVPFMNGVQTSFQMVSHVLIFLKQCAPRDSNFVKTIHIPTLQSVAGISTIALVGLSNIVSSKHYTPINLMDVLCIIFGSFTLGTGISILIKLSSEVSDGYRRVILSGRMKTRAEIIHLCDGLPNIESMMSLKNSGRQQTETFIISFKDPTNAEEFTRNINDNYDELNLKAYLATNTELLNALKIRRINGRNMNVEYGDEFEKGIEVGEGLVSSLVMETLVKSKLESEKTIVKIRKWKVELCSVFNSGILLTSTLALLYGYSSMPQGGFTFLYLYGAIFGIAGVFLGLIGNVNLTKEKHPESICLIANKAESRRGKRMMKQAGFEVIEVVEGENDVIILGHHSNTEIVANARMIMTRELTPDIGELGVVNVEMF